MRTAWWCGARPTRTWCDATWSDEPADRRTGATVRLLEVDAAAAPPVVDAAPSQGKDRPIAIIGRRGDHLLGVPLTSKVKDNELQVAVGTGSWDREGRPSYAKVDRLLDVVPEAVRREGAVLSRRHFDDIVRGVERAHRLGR